MNWLESQLEERQKVIDKQDVMIRELVENAKKEPCATAAVTATVSPRPGVPQMGLSPFSVHIPRAFTPCSMSVSGPQTPRKRPLSTSPGTSLSNLLNQSRPSAANHVSVPKKSRNAEEVKSSHRAGGAANATNATGVVPATPETGKESAKSAPKPHQSAKSMNMEPTLEPEPSTGSNIFSGKPKAPGSPGTPATASGAGASISVEEKNRVAQDLGNLFTFTSNRTDDNNSDTDVTGESAGVLATMAIQDAGMKKKKKRNKKKSHDRDCKRRRDDAPTLPVSRTGSPPKAGCSYSYSFQGYNF